MSGKQFLIALYENLQISNNVHFTETGSEELAKQVAMLIIKKL